MTNILIDFRKSKKEGKKYEIILLIDGKKRSIHFGSNISKTFVEGASIQKRNNYLKRHSVNEDWNYINPGSLSAGILWGDSDDIQSCTGCRWIRAGATPRDEAQEVVCNLGAKFHLGDGPKRKGGPIRVQDPRHHRWLFALPHLVEGASCRRLSSYHSSTAVKVLCLF